MFKPSKHITKIKSIKDSFKKAQSVRKLINSDISSSLLSNVWILENDSVFVKEPSEISEYKIFGTSINLNNINWHRDYVSGFEYPVKRFDKLKISKWFDQGIDVKFPWEVSRFYFAIKLAQNYIITKDEKYYTKFKELIVDWIEKNPFCYGVNWVCTMEVAIRAINWVVAINIFYDIFRKDKEFQLTFNNILVQHAKYISTFPEINVSNHKKHTSNHTTADYTGLLFLAISLNEHTKSQDWLKQAVDGLEECIRYQTYEDGVNFEASINYHRLVLEMFAFSAIVAKVKNVEFSKRYYELLFKMFEYSAAYMDHNGNAPQVGDNDSGKILIFYQSDELNHTYLLDIGEHIFDFNFKSQCQKRNPEFKRLLPKIKKIKINELNVIPRETDQSIVFEKGGAYLLKSDQFSLFISCFPLGQNGKGGHNHDDDGSFTLSFMGNPIIVDPGSYTYTSSFSIRNRLRSHSFHNNLQYNTNISSDALSKNVFNLAKQKKSQTLILQGENESILGYKILTKHNNSNNVLSSIRTITITNTKLLVSEEFNKKMMTNMHVKLCIHPILKIFQQEKKEIIISSNSVKLVLKTNSDSITCHKDYFSPTYGQLIETNWIKLSLSNGKTYFKIESV